MRSEEMGFRNVIVMIPFCRTVTEADRVLAELARDGLERGREGLKLYLMCEIPSSGFTEIESMPHSTRNAAKTRTRTAVGEAEQRLGVAPGR